MKNHLLFYFLLLAIALNAQDTVKNAIPFSDKVEFKVAYNGNLVWNNGLSFGAEYLWKEKLKIKEKRKRKKSINHQFLLNGKLAFTNNFSTQTDAGAFTNWGITWRRTNTKGKQWSIEFNPLGYYRSFLPETYEVVGDEVKKVFLPGRSYYAPSLSIGFGKLRKDKKLTGRYFGINLMYRSPYNGGFAPSLLFQYGYRFHLKKNK